MSPCVPLFAGKGNDDVVWLRQYREGRQVLDSALEIAKQHGRNGLRAHVLRRRAADFPVWAGCVWEYFVRLEGVEVPNGAYRIATFGPKPKRRSYR